MCRARTPQWCFTVSGWDVRKGAANNQTHNCTLHSHVLNVNRGAGQLHPMEFVGVLGGESSQ